MSSAEVNVDGRAARSQRTRDAVVDALQTLIEEGDPQPSARRIAEKAGVSTRSVFAHFSSLDDLHRAMAERAASLVISMLTRIDPDQPLAIRIESLCAQRARISEDVGPLRRAAAVREQSSTMLAQAREDGRRASRDQIARVFAPELDDLDRRARRRRIAAIDAVISGESWDLLRTTHGLPPNEARQSLVETLHQLLSGKPEAARPAAAATAADVDQRTTQQVLEEVEEKIDRLVAAIEVGSPPDLLAPRLQELREARFAAQQQLARARARTDDRGGDR